MEYNFLNVLALVFLVTFATSHAKGRTIPGAQKTAILKGLRAGEELARVLKDGKFRDSLVKLGANLVPFLGVLSPLASTALAFISTGDSKELAFMKAKFEDVNNKLDSITSQFIEVKNAIDWNVYGTYERKIRAAEKNLNRIYKVEGQTRAHERQNFINQYVSDFANSVQKIYDAIMNSDHIFSENILKIAIKATKNHKRKIEQFSLGLVQLLVQGIKVKVSYYGMRNWKSDHVIREWKNKMNLLRKKLQGISDDVKGRYMMQLKIDANEIIQKNHRLDNRELLVKLYDFVVEKYDWRYWFVAVYDDMYGFDDHTIALCGGYTLLHQPGNKNIIIASQDKIYQNWFKQSDANSLLQGIEQDIDDCEIRDPGARARALVGNMGKKAGKSCAPYALHMAVRSGKGLWYISLSTHRAFRELEKPKTTCCWGELRRFTKRRYSFSHRRPNRLSCSRCTTIRSCRGRQCSTEESCWKRNASQGVSWYYNMIVFG